MLIVRVELKSAITGRTQEIARMLISNDGTGTPARGNYDGVTLKGRTQSALDVAWVRWRSTPGTSAGVTRAGRIENHDRKSLHVWHLVGKMLNKMGYNS